MHRPLDMVRALVGRESGLPHRQALDGISFTVGRGEALGLLGRNGSGKSTLLKIVAGVLPPSQGQVVVRGSQSHIIELGAAFDDELSGQRNAEIAAILHGASGRETASAAAKIIEFAELDEVRHEPLRTYSSGMKARLFFSAAITRNPRVLIVDEVLSVGDALFQNKCFVWMREFLERGGSLLFASHDLTAVSGLCARALVLERGNEKFLGETRMAIETYHEVLYKSEGTTSEERPPWLDTDSAGWHRFHRCDENRGDARISAWRLVNQERAPLEHITPGQVFSFEYQVDCDQGSHPFVFGFSIVSYTGQTLWGTNSELVGLGAISAEAGTSVVVEFKLVNALAPGEYILRCGLVSQKDGTRLDFHDRIGVLAVVGERKHYSDSVVSLEAEVTARTEQLPDSQDPTAQRPGS